METIAIAKSFSVAYLIVGARRAVPSSLWAWLAMPQNEIISATAIDSRFLNTKTKEIAQF
jgi:hypothetical protein